jgi:hypothetical protein
VILLIGAAAVPPLALRASAMLEAGGLPALGDLRGALADLGASALALAVLVALGRAGRALAALGALAWALVHVANFEVVMALRTPAAVEDARLLLEPGFLRKSLGGLARPSLEIALLILAGVAAWIGARSTGARTFWISLVLGAALLIPPGGLIRERGGLALWRQTGVVLHNATRLARGEMLSGSAPRVGVEALVALEPELIAPSEVGEPIAPLGIVQNVLLIVAQSLSGAHLPSLAADHGRESPALLPRLDAWARQKLGYSTFLTHDRRSDQGIYALLCGEPPKLFGGRSKLSEYPEHRGRRCLPERLRAQGFHTVYLQAAPLTVMGFHRFLARAGFREVRGHEDFARAYKYTGWGVDDRAFYERALEHVERLEAEGDPWLLVLRNGGTEDPFVVPDDFRSAEPTAFGRTLAYFDGAIADFLEELDRRDIADDTLILVASDQSAGAARSVADRVTAELDQNWGALIVGAPLAQPGRIDTPFAQSDLLLSVLDYLEAAPVERGLIGRSVFRPAPGPRPIPFANQNLGLVGLFESGGSPLTLCRSGLRDCASFAPEGGLFSGRRAPLARSAAPEASQRLAELARAASLSVEALDPVLPIELAAPAHFTLQDARGLVLMAGQEIELTVGQWLEVEFELEVLASPPTAAVEVRHWLRGDRRRARYSQNFRVGAGERVRVLYSYAASAREPRLEARTVLRRLSAGSVEIELHRAELRLHREGPPPAPGVKRLAFDRQYSS